MLGDIYFSVGTMFYNVSRDDSLHSRTIITAELIIYRRFSRSSSPSKVKVRKRSTSRSLTASAVANLRACNEELRKSLAELKSEVTELSGTVERSDRAKVGQSLLQ